jgi:DNA helicase HerA-like ATPase
MTETDTKGYGQQAAAAIGHVIAIREAKVTLRLEAPNGAADRRITIGNYVAVKAGPSTLVGVIAALAAKDDTLTPMVCADLDLLGEIMQGAGGKRFKRGVTSYPAIGDAVYPLPAADLQLVFQVSATSMASIGSLHQDGASPACVRVDDLLAKHFAVLGTTGVGKSSGVAVILREVLAARPDLRVFLLDVHNEYAACFGTRVNVVTPRSLKLPFWLFNLEELTDVIYGGRPPIDEEIEILAELIPLAKGKYAQYKESSERALVKRQVGKLSGYTVDTPVPYVLQDLLSLIDERMGRLENRVSRMHYHRLITRIETIRNDPRYGFMFDNANVGGDMMGELLGYLFRIEPDGRPITIMQLAGLPAEVVDAVVCVLCRLAFEFGIWSEGAVPLLFICEEAHRYASADKSVGFSPTRRALSRIAREGRKHGVHLGLVSQRPFELDPTILSQCSTLFAMRMANERDQALLSAAVSDAANLLSFVPLLGTGECIAFGEGVPVPVRIRFKQLDPSVLPRSDTLGRDSDMRSTLSSSDFVGAVVERWRGATMNKVRSDAEPAPALPVREINAEPGSSTALDQAHRRLLRRPLDGSEAAAPASNTSGSLWQR